ncbi:MAG: hypothetical protein Q8Q08_06045 [Candidatus Omnitrophota bacterium]|nr:hypothetical protein [Candidatus Omnitrophota bacterium]MDZ4242019.1 hypothetical protein [Candidatus Omnitrophota bacterium]
MGNRKHMGRVLLVFSIFHFLFSIFVSSSHASGAAARRNVRVQAPQIRTRPAPRAPVRPAEEPQEEEAKPAPAPKKAETVYPSGRVLMSSPGGQARSPVSVPSRSSQPAPRPAPAASGGSDLAMLFQEFDKSSEMWPMITDMRIKMLVVARYVDLYRQFNVEIRKPAIYYVNLINAMSRNNPEMLRQPFDQLLRVVAIVEYDYDSGENKDALARTILTDETAFRANKRRVGMK